MNQVLIVFLVTSVVTTLSASIPVKDAPHRPPSISPTEDVNNQESATIVDSNLGSSTSSSLENAAVGSIDSLLKDQQTSVAEEKSNRDLTISSDGKLEREVKTDNNQSVNTHEENHHSKTLTGEKHLYTITMQNQNQGKVVVREQTTSVGDPSLTSPVQVKLEDKHKLLVTDDSHTHKILEDILNNKKINQEETVHLVHDILAHDSLPDNLHQHEQKTVFTQDVVDHEKDLRNRNQIKINIHGTGDNPKEVAINDFTGTSGQNQNVPASLGISDNSDGGQDTAQALPTPTIYISMLKHEGEGIEQKTDENLDEDKKIVPAIDVQKTDKQHHEHHGLSPEDELHTRLHLSQHHHDSHSHGHKVPVHKLEPKDVPKPTLSVNLEPQVINTDNTRSLEEESSKKVEATFDTENSKKEEEEVKLEVSSSPKEEKSNEEKSVVGSPAIVKDLDPQHHVHDHHPHHDLHWKHHHAIDDCDKSHEKKFPHEDICKPINDEKKTESGIQFSSGVGSVKNEEGSGVGISADHHHSTNSGHSHHDDPHLHSPKHHHEGDYHWDHHEKPHFPHEGATKVDEKKIIIHDHHDPKHNPVKDEHSFHHEPHSHSPKPHHEHDYHWDHHERPHFPQEGATKVDEKKIIIHDHHDPKHNPVKDEHSFHHDPHSHSPKHHHEDDYHWDHDEKPHFAHEGATKVDEKKIIIHDHHDPKHNPVKDDHSFHHDPHSHSQKDYHGRDHYHDHDDDDRHYHYQEKHHGGSVKQDGKVHEHHDAKYNPVKDEHSHHHGPHWHSEKDHHEHGHHWDQDDDQGHYHYNEKHHEGHGKQDDKITHHHHDAKYNPSKDGHSYHHDPHWHSNKDHHEHDHHWGHDYDDEGHYHYKEIHHKGNVKEEKIHDHHDIKHNPVKDVHPDHLDPHWQSKKDHHDHDYHWDHDYLHDEFNDGSPYGSYWTEI